MSLFNREACWPETKASVCTTLLALFSVCYFPTQEQTLDKSLRIFVIYQMLSRASKSREVQIGRDYNSYKISPMFPLSSVTLQKSTLRVDQIKTVSCSFSTPVGIAHHLKYHMVVGTINTISGVGSCS